MPDLDSLDTAFESDSESRGSDWFQTLTPRHLRDDGSSTSERNQQEEQEQDPFGFQGIAAGNEAVRRIDREIEKRRGWRTANAFCPRWLCSCFGALSAGAQPAKLKNEVDIDPILNQNEDMGAQKAAGMTRCWHKSNLITCLALYV